MAQKKGVQESSNKTNEIVGVIFIAVAALCALTVYFNITSVFGETVSGFIFGLFGAAGYVFPVVTGTVGVLFILSRKNKKDIRRILLIVILILMMLCLIHLGVTETLSGDNFGMYMQESYTIGTLEHSGGGVIGGAITYPVYLVLGLIGGYIVFIAVMAVSVVAFTNLSIKKVGADIGHAVRDRYETYVEYREVRRQERNRQPLFIENLNETNAGDEDNYQQNPFDIRIEAGENTLNVDRVYKRPRKTKNSSDNKIEILSVGDAALKNNFKKEEEAFVESSLELYTEGRLATAKVRKIKAESEKAAEVRPSVSSDAAPKKRLIKSEDIPFATSEESADNTADDYVYPPLSLLQDGRPSAAVSSLEKKRNSEMLEHTLADFGITAKVESISIGPVVTRYEVKPTAGIKVSRIVNLADDIAMAFACGGVRIEAPIPGKSAVGIEVPNTSRGSVMLKELLASPEFKKFKSSTIFAVGKDIAGKNIYADIRKMPHLLIAGETNSGKSVCVNSLIASILYNASPKEVKMIMIDPKMVELSEYNNIPHLLVPVVTDLKKAPAALQWAVNEMTMRYRMLAAHGVKEITSYNEKIVKEGKEQLPKLIIIVDEVAELMMAAKKDVEDSICRIAQLGRAAGIHLVVATQRPSVNVITGVIKANIPSRIAFTVSSQIDSRTILDRPGADKLLGQGDMLFMPTGSPKPMRIQGCFVDEQEIHALCDFLRENNKPSYDSEIEDTIKSHEKSASGSSDSMDIDDDEDQTDNLFPEAVKLVVDSGQASISMVQRRFRVGYARAARLIDEMELRGYVSGFEGSKARQVLITKEQFAEIFGDEYGAIDDDQ